MAKRTSAIIVLLVSLVCACGSSTPTTSATLFRLTVTSTGGGTVRSTPEGIDCPSRCQESSLFLASGTRISLAATPDASRIFSGWSGDCAGVLSCELVLDRDRSVHAIFTSTLAGDGGARPDAGAPPADAGIDAGTTPTVRVDILTPGESELVSTGTIEVTARITSSTALDPARIEAQLGTLPATRMSPLGGIDTYRASIPLVGAVSGAQNLVVRASTIDSRMASATRRLLIDAGPNINIARPLANEPVKDALAYDFTVTIAADLVGRVTVASVTATIGACEIMLPSPASGGRYAGTWAFSRCTPALSQGPQQLVVTAQDSEGVRGQRNATFQIDRDGPIVTIRAPTTGQLVGGIMQIDAEVRDTPSGVDSISVQATVSHGGTDFTVALQQVMADRFTGMFDTRRLPNPTTIQFPSVQVVARDNVGNQTMSGGIVVTLDNVPAIGSLDPPHVELVQRRNPPQPWLCSNEFDPVGSETANDGQIVPQLFYLRAMVEDRGNIGVGSTTEIISKVREVTLHVLGDTTRPLVVDSDGDGICDSVNPQVIPTPGTPRTPSQVLSLALQKLPGAGNADFRMHSDPHCPGLCIAGEGMGNAQAPLCDTTTMTYVLQDHDLAEPLIWAIPPLAIAGQGVCVGVQFDAGANNMPDGWICATLSFVDGVGNRSVSRPLRLCLDKAAGTTCNAPAIPPHCTGTYNRITGAVTQSPCFPTDFEERTCRYQRR